MRYISIKKVAKIQISDIILFFFLLFALELDSLHFLTPINSILNSKISLFIFAGIGLIMILQKRRISSVYIYILFFFLIYIFATGINDYRNIPEALRTISSPLVIATITEYYLPKRKERFVSVVILLLMMLIICDIISILTFHDGLYRTRLYAENWILGYKSARVRAAGIPLVVFAGIDAITKKNGLTVSFWTLSLLSVVDAYLSGATAGTGSLIFLVFLIAAFFVIKKERFRKYTYRILSPGFIAIVVIALNVMFSIMQRFTNLEYIITNIFEKSMTLHGRTKIWTMSIYQFLKSPIIGSGYISSVDFASLTGVLGGTQPHNLILGLLVYTGIVGTVFYCYMFLKSEQIISKDNPNGSTIVLLGVISYIFFGITSFTMFAQFHYAFFVMIYYFTMYENEDRSLRIVKLK